MFRSNIVLLVIGLFVVVGSASAQCPKIAVIGPAGVTMPGDEMNFAVEGGAAGPRLTYSWTVSSGTIVKGQGTTEITVRTDRKIAGPDLTASVEINGLPSSCPRSASETAPINQIIVDVIRAEWDASLKNNVVREQLDVVFADLSNNPTHTGIIVLIVTQDEPMDASNKRLRFILRHAAYRKFDRARFWFQFELGDHSRTKVYRIPPGAELLCEKCPTIKGADIQ